MACKLKQALCLPMALAMPYGRMRGCRIRIQSLPSQCQHCNATGWYKVSNVIKYPKHSLLSLVIIMHMPLQPFCKPKARYSSFRCADLRFFDII